AATWMPDDPRADKWMETAKLYIANTYTVPVDSAGPLKKWIQTQTLFPSYTIENHGFFHPSYQIAGLMSLGDTYLMGIMTDPSIIKEIQPFIEHNIMPVWEVTKSILTETGDMAYP